MMVRVSFLDSPEWYVVNDIDDCKTPDAKVAYKTILFSHTLSKLVINSTIVEELKTEMLLHAK